MSAFVHEIWTVLIDLQVLPSFERVIDSLLTAIFAGVTTMDIATWIFGLLAELSLGFAFVFGVGID